MDQEFGSTLPWSSGLGYLTREQSQDISGHLLKLQSSAWGGLVKRRFMSLWQVSEELIPRLLDMGWKHHFLAVHASLQSCSQQGSLLPAENERGKPFCTLTLEVTAHQFCFLFFFLKVSTQVQAVIKGKELYKGIIDYQESEIVGSHSRSYLFRA